MSQDSNVTRPQRGEDREEIIEMTLEEVFSGTIRQLKMQSNDVCQSCNGTGLRSGQRCPNCMGLGVVPRSKRLEVRIPAGVDEGMRVRLTGEGERGRAGGPAGDLYLRIQILPHPVFRRISNDLHTTVSLTEARATQGGEIAVPLLTGEISKLMIEPGTEDGKVICLKELGLPVLNQPDVRGNLYVEIKVTAEND